MTPTKKKSKIAMPPTPLNSPDMLAAINKGGSVRATMPAANAEAQTDDKLKSFTFKIYESELAQIRQIQERLPKRDRKSIHDFVLAAVKDKIAREQKRVAD